MSVAAARWSIACGAATAIPIPLLDALVERAARRKVLCAVAAARGQAIHPSEIAAIVGRVDGLAGCLTAVLWWPIKKLFRTVFFVLALKDVVDGAALALIQADLFAHALDRGHLPARSGAVRDAMAATLADERWSPVSRRLLRLPRPALSSPFVRAEAGAGPLDRLIVALVGVLHRDAGAALHRARFLSHLEGSS